MEKPEVPLVIVRYLEECFPDRVPHADTPEYEKCALAGEQRVVRRLRQIYNEQNEEEDDDN